ncbi:hypothetical protein BGW42_008723 [Actinomortierella wolfii]|nr:hypothetical protein BGW42_008723 [Actinomortierella wolfii]
MMLHPGAKHPGGLQPTPHRPPPQQSGAVQDGDQSYNSASSTSAGSTSFSSTSRSSTTSIHDADTDPNSPTALAELSRRRGEYLTALAIMRPKVLDYDVHSCSSYSASYLPENIKVNNPQDQSSRWSSGSNNQMQYIMIKLKKMAIARNKIGFWAFKGRVTNLQTWYQPSHDYKRKQYEE